MADVPNWVSTVVTALGATWYLGRLLGKIESVLKSHVDDDKRTHDGIEARVLRLERHAMELSLERNSDTYSGSHSNGKGD